MPSTENTVTVFTGKSFDTIIREGGSQAWKLDAARAKKCEYLVCTQNAHNPEPYADGAEPHGSAFLVGRISRISPATGIEDGRWKIEFSEYARISQPSVWTGDRNPVRYTTLDDLGIHLDAANFVKFEDSTPTPPLNTGGLTIRQAKAGLAQTYDVDVDSIEIVIRG
ncbi:hypothetical protein J6K27_000044 [Rhodococcus qingshengii]|uniref:hypothetical protein n=1 Tax=Rhodococcus qingshengii TaxID=334542 RepID=UPI001AF00413|nr:hypothetical protein [Rhodococcus qingshengii]QTS00547.1 hypothetical protein J6K27_000044 [Rhodococcus qingshengii]